MIASSSRAFYVTSRRDVFEETKRSFAYFMGIVRRKQRESDSARLRRRSELDRTRQRLEHDRRHDRAVERERVQELEDLRKNPERVVLSVADRLMRGEFRLLVTSLRAKLSSALESLQRLGRNTKRGIEELGFAIRSLAEPSEELKRRMLELLEQEALAVRERVKAQNTSAQPPPSS